MRDIQDSGRLPVLDVRPGDGIGPIDIGMTRDESRAAAAASGLGVGDFRRGATPPPNTHLTALSVVYFELGLVLWTDTKPESTAEVRSNRFLSERQSHTYWTDVVGLIG
jgi:hypothetical protein